MCTHEDHDALWPELPRLQSEDSFYSHTTKCKKCYIYLQTERVRRARQGLGPSPRAGGRRARGEATGPQQQALMLEQYQAALAKQRPSKRRALPAAAAAAGEDPAVEALLGAPVVHVPPAASPEDAAALRGAAVAAAWGAAILDEVRELSPAGTELPEQVRGRSCVSFVSSRSFVSSCGSFSSLFLLLVRFLSSSFFLQSASLSLLLASLRSALARAAGRAAPREAAQLAGVWRLAEARLAQAAAATRAAAAEAPALGGGCPCGRSYEYQSNAGPPVLCQVPSSPFFPPAFLFFSLSP